MAAPARSNTAAPVAGVPRELFATRGVPRHIRSGNEPEFIAKKVRSWLEENRVGPLCIEPGAPWQNAFGERFNGKLRDERLNLELFTSLAEARVVIGDFKDEHNHRRPHSSLGCRTPHPRGVRGGVQAGSFGRSRCARPPSVARLHPARGVGRLGHSSSHLNWYRKVRQVIATPSVRDRANYRRCRETLAGYGRTRGLAGRTVF